MSCLSVVCQGDKKQQKGALERELGGRVGGLAGSPGEGSVAGQRWAVELGRGKTGQPLYDKPPLGLGRSPEEV